jgi:hypothetical protein
VTYTIVLVCGGQLFLDRDHLDRTLDDVRAHYGELIIIHGGAVGADLMAKAWAIGRGQHNAEVKALWGLYGKAAGPIRNGVLAALRPHLCLGFKGGNGTADMLAQARAAGIETYEV